METGQSSRGKWWEEEEEEGQGGGGGEEEEKEEEEEGEGQHVDRVRTRPSSTHGASALELQNGTTHNWLGLSRGVPLTVPGDLWEAQGAVGPWQTGEQAPCSGQPLPLGSSADRH